MTEPALSFLRTLSRIPLWHFIWISVSLSVFMSMVLSYLIHERLAWDYPFSAACISMTVSSLVLLIIKHMRTEQQFVEDQLRQSGERLRAIIENEPECVKVVSAEGALLEINPAGLQIMEADSVQAVLGHQAISFVHSEDRLAFHALHNSVVQGQQGTLQFRLVSLRGTVRSMETHSVPLRDRSGQITAVLSVTRDVTARKQAEDALRASERQFSSAFECAAIGMALVAPDGRWLRVNRSLCALTGYAPDELLSTTVQDITHPDDLESDLGYRRQMLDDEIPTYQIEQGYRHKLGQIVWVLISASLVRDDQGLPLHFIYQIQDITERKAADAVLQAKTEQLELIAEAMTEFFKNGSWEHASTRLLRGALALTKSEYGFIGVVADGPVVRVLAHEGIVWNSGTNHELYEQAMDTYKSKGYLEFTNLNNLFGHVITTGQVVIANEPSTDPRSGGLPPGHPPLHHFLGVPILRGADVVGIIGIANRPGGYTGREQAAIQILTQAVGVLYESYLRHERGAELEAQLQQSQKLEAIGRLAGGLAHDFNNLLTIIIGNGELLWNALPTSESPTATQLSQVRQAADSAALLVKQLLAFSRKQVLDPTVLDLNAVLSTVSGLVRRLIGEDIDLVMSLDPELGAVKADYAQLEQVIMNLAANARDAMPSGGKLTITTTNVDATTLHNPGPVDLPGPYVLLTVSDTGSGMDAATQAQIFEPFFTTKALGRGTGLGLSSVYGIVQQSGGHIFVHSELHRGTSFHIYLPRVNEEIMPSRPSPPAQDMPRGTATVLVVEDESAIRSFIQSHLTSLGYTVLEARHGVEALLLCHSHQGPIHLLLTDVVMPEMHGPALADQLKPRYPELKILYMSGYGHEYTENLALLESCVGFLQKPFSLERLARKVHEILSSK